MPYLTFPHQFEGIRDEVPSIFLIHRVLIRRHAGTIESCCICRINVFRVGTHFSSARSKIKGKYLIAPVVLLQVCLLARLPCRSRRGIPSISSPYITSCLSQRISYCRPISVFFTGMDLQGSSSFHLAAKVFICSTTAFFSSFESWSLCSGMNDLGIPLSTNRTKSSICRQTSGRGRAEPKGSERKVPWFYL